MEREIISLISSYRDTNSVHRGSNLTTNHLPKVPSPNSITLGIRTSTYTFGVGAQTMNYGMFLVREPWSSQESWKHLVRNEVMFDDTIMYPVCPCWSQSWPDTEKGKLVETPRWHATPGTEQHMPGLVTEASTSICTPAALPGCEQCEHCEQKVSGEIRLCVPSWEGDWIQKVCVSWGWTCQERLFLFFVVCFFVRTFKFCSLRNYIVQRHQL